MKSRAVGRFWRLYDGLPAEIRRAADKQFVLWLNNRGIAHCTSNKSGLTSGPHESQTRRLLIGKSFG